MDILYALEKIRTPFWNGVMSAVTQLGGEVIFIVAAVVVFWCVSKWEGYYPVSYTHLKAYPPERMGFFLTRR